MDQNLAEGIFMAVNAILDFYHDWLGWEFIAKLQGLFAQIFNAGHDVLK